jgi:hypothetical protein
MKIVDSADLWDTARSSKRKEIYDEIAALPKGKTAILSPGDEIWNEDDTLETVRMRVIAAMRWRGVTIRTHYKDGQLLVTRVEE